jgi:hypothetical protein
MRVRFKRALTTMNMIQIDPDEYPSQALLIKQVASGVTPNPEHLKEIANLVDLMSISVEQEAGRMGVLIPFYSLAQYFSDGYMSDAEGLTEAELADISDESRVVFGRKFLSGIDAHLDADLHPGFLVIGLSSQGSSLVIAYTITGYSFSGIEVLPLAIGQNLESLLVSLKTEYLIVDTDLMGFGSDFSQDPQVSDEMILKNWCR